MKVATSQERISALLDSDSRSDTAIGKQFGVSKQAVSSWRTGSRSPKKSILEKIAQAYNVSLDWLMGFDVERDNVRKTPDVNIYSKLILGMSPEDYYTVMKILEKTEIEMRKKGLL